MKILIIISLLFLACSSPAFHIKSETKSLQEVNCIETNTCKLCFSLDYSREFISHPQEEECFFVPVINEDKVQGFIRRCYNKAHDTVERKLVLSDRVNSEWICNTTGEGTNIKHESCKRAQ